MKINAILVDLDGTLCNVDHRLQYISTNPKNWKAWNIALIYDTPNYPVLEVVNALSKKYKILIVTGRSDEYQSQTEQWLNQYKILYDEIYMRQYKDHRDDSIVKSEIADEIQKQYEIFAVFEDRNRVKRMWKKRGYWVFDCNQTDEEF